MKKLVVTLLLSVVCFGQAVPSVKHGYGSPEGVVAGVIGDIYQRQDGGDGTTFYVKQSAASFNFGWVAYTPPVSPGGSNGNIQANIAGAFGAAKQDLVDAPAFCSDAGSTDAYACTLAPAITAYVTGTHYRFKAATANTGAASINFNALGAKTVVKVAGGITTTLADNDIRVGQWVDVVYDGTNMQMQSLLGNAPSTTPSFSAVTSGANSGAAMVIDTGASLDVSGSGSNNATKVNGISITGTPAVGNIPTATSSSAATWQAPAAGVPAAISGTYAAIAATTCNAANSGQIGLATNSLLEARCTGSAWQWRMGGFNVTTPPASAGCSWGTTQGGAAVSDAQGGMFLTAPTNSGDQYRMLYNCSGLGYPSSTFSWTVAMIPTANAVNYNLEGICISDGTKIQAFGVGFDDSQKLVFAAVYSFTNQTTFSTATSFAGGQWGPMIYLTYVDDLASTRSYYISNNPFDLQRVLVLTSSRTNFLTPTRIGPCVNANNTTNGVSSLYLHWSNASI